MRKLMILVTLLTLIAVLAACGGTSTTGGGGASSAGDPPEVVARNWFTAYLNADPDAAANLTCTPQRDSMRAGVQAFADAQAAAPTQGEFDLSGLNFTIDSQSENTATLSASGSIRVTIAGQTVEQSVDQFGIPVTVELALEGSSWLVCPPS